MYPIGALTNGDGMEEISNIQSQGGFPKKQESA